MAFEGRELFRVLFLDKKNGLIADEIQGAGTVDHTPVYPREVVKRALELQATALILVHNHPSGHAQPSAGDRALTEELTLAGELLRIHLLDHVIVGQRDHYSFADHGLIEEYRRRSRRPS